MLKRSLLAVGLIIMSLSNVYALPYGFFDARSVGMGNVSVATGGLTTAAFSNPGMLSVNENDDSFALLLPAIGVQVIDDGNVIDLVDEFQETNSIQRQVDILNELSDASLTAAVIPSIAFISAGESVTWGLTLKSTISLSADLVNVVVPSLNNLVVPSGDIRALAVAATEIGIPLGTEFSFAGMQLSVGITPRFVQVDLMEYNESILTADLNDIADVEKEDLGNFTTFDAGISLNVFDRVRVGLVAKNLIEETKISQDGTKIDFETHLRAGAAIDMGFMTIAADMDLTERKPIAFENPSKSMSVGVEFDAFSVVQLRLGYQTNLASGSTDPDLLSVGLGLWLGFNVDVAVVAGDDSSIGAFFQTGFHF
ncbi:hypothetical protein MNBD_GAMMA07-1304 [hydrothermal vent metagenome]|uniref:DUF5723 domain-containing protein n=1 Tax=hydrothermal vent metagenome TaxID=652676 RepID=A0A3B0WJM7_9ZZZZ